jgi:hypothetical protein
MVHFANDFPIKCLVHYTVPTYRKFLVKTTLRVLLVPEQVHGHEHRQINDQKVALQRLKPTVVDSLKIHTGTVPIYQTIKFEKKSKNTDFSESTNLSNQTSLQIPKLTYNLVCKLSCMSP